MATVPHTPAPCEPLTTLIAECFGDQPPPASPLPTPDPAAETHWHNAVTQAGELLRAKLRVEALPERLHKALALVPAHAVTLHPDGTASVQHGTQTSRLAPDCPCTDATHRAELCTHTLAVELHRLGTCPARQHRPSQQSHGRASPRERAAASQCGSTAGSDTSRRWLHPPGAAPQR